MEVRTGNYGPEWRHGVVTDHLPAGAVTRVSPSGRTYLVEDGERVPVLCGELAQVWTEDGPIVGRCGDYVLHDGYACPGHTVEREAYSALSEIERDALERREDAAR